MHPLTVSRAHQAIAAAQHVLRIASQIKESAYSGKVANFESITPIRQRLEVVREILKAANQVCVQFETFLR